MAQGDMAVAHKEVTCMVSVKNIHFYRMPNVSWFILCLEKYDSYRLNDLSGYTARSNTVGSGTGSIPLVLKGQGLGQLWTTASWSLLGNSRRSVTTDHKGSIKISWRKVKDSHSSKHQSKRPH